MKKTTKKAEPQPEPAAPGKKTMIDFILWYNEDSINLNQLAKDAIISYPTLLKFRKGRGVSNRTTAQAVANALNIDINTFYDIKNNKHLYYD